MRAGWIAAAAALLLAGCTSGRDFARPPSESLALGRTTYAEIVEQYGSPRREATVVKNDRTITIASYGYAVSTADSLVGGVLPGRRARFHFVDQRLVGHDFFSSFAADATDFDETKISAIRKGTSTRAQVVGLFGPPVGVHAYPLTRREGDTALLYVYEQTRVEPRPFSANVKTYRKELTVSLDGAGVVTDVEFSASGEK
ncbi:MAG TPA: hypothetical protein VGT02_08015 [Methylomirabilota bacterium]|jgi:hypothetical protein|nr:hypothetical protein [Methylomirabilota bacterium]